MVDRSFDNPERSTATESPFSLMRRCATVSASSASHRGDFASIGGRSIMVTVPVPVDLVKPETASRLSSLLKSIDEIVEFSGSELSRILAPEGHSQMTTPPCLLPQANRRPL